MTKLKKWQREVNWRKSNDIDRCCLTCKYKYIDFLDTVYMSAIAIYCKKHNDKTMWNAVCDDWKKR